VASENFVLHAAALGFARLAGKMGLGVVEATELVEGLEVVEIQSAYQAQRQTEEVLVVVEAGK